MSVSKKLLQAAAGAAGAEALDVDEVFSPFLYTTDGTSSKTITNNIDLSGEGGLAWLKSRSISYSHSLYDTERGVQKQLQTDATTAESTETGGLTAFTSTGFTIGNVQNQSALGDMVAWTFRKAPKFFDVIDHTQTGSEPSTVTLNHNLGCDVGMIIAKVYSHTNAWVVWHKDLGSNYAMDFSTGAKSYFGGTGISTSSTQITIPGSWVHAGYDSQNTIIYLFAHNNGDGEFGPDADQDIIKFGSYTGNGSTTGPSINLGFEPQFVMIKESSAAGNWWMLDSMRGIASGSADVRLKANTSDAEDTTGDVISLTPTGFKVTTSSSSTNSSGETYIYMAIRRGPLAPPESATDVFKVDQGHASNVPNFESGFPVDFGLLRQTSADGFKASARLTEGKYLETSSTAAESSNSNYSFDYQDGWVGSAFGTSYYSWMWRRAPSYFDVVAYTGTGSAMTVNHNLGAVPEMMWVKSRSTSDDWAVYHSALGNTDNLFLNGTNATASRIYWNNTTPTATQFSLGDHSKVSNSGTTYIAYLFATVAGVSKVGSVNITNTGNFNVDCGFSNGARFVMVKAFNQSAPWYVSDSVRGINAGSADPLLFFDNNQTTNTASDWIEPYSAGFTIKGNFYNGYNLIFYAIA